MGRERASEQAPRPELDGSHHTVPVQCLFGMISSIGWNANGNTEKIFAGYIVVFWMTVLRSTIPSLDRPRRKHEYAIRLVIFFIGVTVGLAAITYRHQWSAQPGFEEGNVAIHLLRGEGFASPFYLGPDAAPPSAYCAPVYPLIIAGCFRAVPQHGAILLLAINCVCVGIIAASIYELGRFYVSRAAGIWAAILLLIQPAFLFYVGDLWDAFVALAIFLAIIC
jgi:hypothetical protein